MNPERRQVIVREIEHWRRSKVLPDQYCDFLLNLYADPEEQMAYKEPNTVGKAVAAIQKATGMQWFLTFGTFTLISIVVLYFSRFPPVMQIVIVASACFIFLRLGIKMRVRNEAFGLAATGIGMLVLLAGGLHLLELYSLTDWGWTTAFLAVCALFWIVYGIKQRIAILHLCGWLTALLVYGWLLFQFTDEPKWYEAQLYWLPLAILFGWGSWFIHRWTKPVSAILFIICALAWFLPELYSALIIGSSLIIQIQILIKIAIGGAALFFMRKQWMVWVV